MKNLYLLFVCIVASAIVSCKKHSSSSGYAGWRTYAGSKDGNRYSSNDEITLKNVSQLKVAWTYSSNDKDSANRSQNQCNPIMVDGILYGTSPKLKLFALDAATGEQKWLFDPATADGAKYGEALFIGRTKMVKTNEYFRARALRPMLLTPRMASR